MSPVLQYTINASSDSRLARCHGKLQCVGCASSAPVLELSPTGCWTDTCAASSDAKRMPTAQMSAYVSKKVHSNVGRAESPLQYLLQHIVLRESTLYELVLVCCGSHIKVPASNDTFVQYGSHTRIFPTWLDY